MLPSSLRNGDAASSKRGSILGSLFLKASNLASLPSIIDSDDEDCLQDSKLESKTLTDIWKDPDSKLNHKEKELLSSLFEAYRSRTDALRTYQSELISLTSQISDLKTSNAALKTQLDITSQAHASLLTEITTPTGGHPSSPRSPSGRFTPESSAEDSGFWEEDNLSEGEEELTMRSHPSSFRHIGGRWNEDDTGEVRLLRNENVTLREEIKRLEGVLEDSIGVLGSLGLEDIM